MLGTPGTDCAVGQMIGPYRSPSREESLVDHLEHIAERLSEFYSDPNSARAWLYSPHRYFDGLRPADLIQEGRVQEVLEAIQALADPGHT